MNRVAPGGFVYHVVNRANGRRRLFKKPDDFLAFFNALRQTHLRHPTRLLAWCVMSNHWHFVVHPREDGELTRFFGYLGLLHATRWQIAHSAVGLGHVYQSRFRNFMVQKDEHLQWVLRYVERNPLRAGMVKRAQDYPWSSLRLRSHPSDPLAELLSPCPIDLPANWVQEVNRAQSEAEEQAIRDAQKRGSPLGEAGWVKRTAGQQNLLTTLRPRGRPQGWRKKKDSE